MAFESPVSPGCAAARLDWSYSLDVLEEPSAAVVPDALLPDVLESVEPVAALPVVSVVSVVAVDEVVSVDELVVESVELDVSVAPVEPGVVVSGVVVVVVALDDVSVCWPVCWSVCWGCCVWVHESAWAAAAASSVDETITAKVFLRISGPSGVGSFCDPWVWAVFGAATVWE
jgi:hypothetical protein